MSVVLIIPARLRSSRFPEKPLCWLEGATGQRKTLIQRCWEIAGQVQGIDEVYVATDSDKIAAVCQGFGADVLMTAESCRNGTERVYDAARQLPHQPDIVVNLQGDAPLTPPGFIEALIAGLQTDSSADMATPGLRCDAETLAMFQEDRRNGKVGGTTVVFDRHYHALYFSKEVMPFTKPEMVKDIIPVFHHVGLYAYRYAALEAYMTWPIGPLEQYEELEQLRFLESGKSIKIVEVASKPGQVFWEVNNPEDVERVSAVLKAQGIA